MAGRRNAQGIAWARKALAVLCAAVLVASQASLLAWAAGNQPVAADPDPSASANVQAQDAAGEGDDSDDPSNLDNPDDPEDPDNPDGPDGPGKTDPDDPDDPDNPDNPDGPGKEDPDDPSPDGPDATQSAKVTLVLRAVGSGSGPDGAWKVGDVVEFTVSVHNAGTAAARNVVLRDMLDGAAFMRDESSDPSHVPAWTLEPDPADKSKQVARIASLPAGATVVCKAAYTVTKADGKAGSFTHAVSATYDGAKADLSSNALVVPCVAEGGGGGSDGGGDPERPAVRSIADFAVVWGLPGTDTRRWSALSKYVYNRGESVQCGVAITWSNYVTTDASAAEAMRVRWASSDPDIATVDSDGKVVPQGKNGWVRITAYGTTDSPATCDLRGSLNIYFGNQEEKTSIRVYHRDGTLIPEYGEGSTLTFTTLGSTDAAEIYAEIDFDGHTYSSRDKGSDFQFQVENIEMANCEYPGSGVTYVWADKNAYDGSTQLFVSIDLGGNPYVRTVGLNVAAGDESEGDRAGVRPDKLTVSVSWEDDPNPKNPTITEYDYTLDELNQMAGEYHAYTIIGYEDGSKKYGYQVARGVRLVALLNDCDIYEDDILYLDVKATDQLSVNSQAMGMAYFLSPRYYYPNFYLGRNTSGAQAVPAMIAMSDRVYWNARAETVSNKVNTYSEISGGVGPNAPRLCIGGVNPYATGGRVSVSNIEAIHVVLAGAPPANPDVRNGGTTGGGTGGGGSDDQGAGGSGGGAGGVEGQGTGQGAAPTGPAEGSGSGVQAGRDVGGNAGVDAGGQQSASDSATNGGGGAAAQGPADDAGSPVDSWKIYQMMSTAQTQVPITEVENPYWPWAFPLACLVCSAGALWYLLWYVREVRDPRGSRKPGDPRDQGAGRPPGAAYAR